MTRRERLCCSLHVVFRREREIIEVERGEEGEREDDDKGGTRTLSSVNASEPSPRGTNGSWTRIRGDDYCTSRKLMMWIERSVSGRDEE